MVFVARGMVIVIYFGNIRFSLWCMLGSFLSLPLSCPWIAVSGPVVFYGMAGWLVLVALVIGILGLLLFGCLGAYPVDASAFWTLPDYWGADDLAPEMPDAPNIWTDGSGEDFALMGGFEVAGAGVYLPAHDLAFDGAGWEVAEEYGDARLERCRAFMPVPRTFAVCAACFVLGCHRCSAVLLAVSLGNW